MTSVSPLTRVGDCILNRVWRVPRPWQIGGLIAIGLGLRLWVLLGTYRLSADEAIPGLMARHILFSGELPVFYWGQSYFGALESYLVAGLFFVLGFHPLLVFAPAILASVALIPLTWLLAERLGPPRAGFIAAVPVAVTPPIFGRVLENAGGGFALGCAFELATAVLLMRALSSSSRRFGSLAAAALTGGLAAWVWQPALLALPLLLVFVFAHAHPFRSIRGAACATPALLGLLPMLAYNITWHWPTLPALVAKFEQQSSTGDDVLAQLHNLGVIVFVTLGGGEESFGGSNPAQAIGLAASLAIGLPVIAVVGMRDSGPPARQRVVSGVVLLVVTAVGFTAAHGGARYLAGLFVGGCAFAGALVALLMVRAPRLGGVTAAVWVLLCVAPNLSGYARLDELMAPEQLSQLDQTDAAVQALEQRGLTTGYADYWAAYPITYASAERIVVAPSLPFHYSGRVDRYPAYTEQVDAEQTAQRVFLLVDDQCSAQPYRDALESSGATFRAEPVARWLLIWDIQPEPGAESSTLANFHETVAAQQTC